MSDENKSGQGLNIVGDAQAGAMKAFMEPILRSVLPMLEPARKKLEDFLGEDEKMIIIRRPKGSDAFVVIMDTDNIEIFTTKSDDYKKYSTKEFVQMLMDGNMGDIFGGE